MRPPPLPLGASLSRTTTSSSVRLAPRSTRTPPPPLFVGARPPRSVTPLTWTTAPLSTHNTRRASDAVALASIVSCAAPGPRTCTGPVSRGSAEPSVIVPVSARPTPASPSSTESSAVVASAAVSAERSEQRVHVHGSVSSASVLTSHTGRTVSVVLACAVVSRALRACTAHGPGVVGATNSALVPLAVSPSQALVHVTSLLTAAPVTLAVSVTGCPRIRAVVGAESVTATGVTVMAARVLRW
jgi:hypothetical protein